MTRSSSRSDATGGRGNGDDPLRHDRSAQALGAAHDAARPNAIRGPAFGVPAAPMGGRGVGDEPIRIVDPTGDAIGWVAPGAGAGCVGFAVRQRDPRGDRWVHLLPPDARDRGGAHPGGTPISPVLVLPESGTADASLPAVRAPVLEWRFAGRDPTAVVLAADVAPDAGALGVHLRFTARLDDATLWLTVDADNAGIVPIAVGLGLRFRPAFASSPEKEMDGLSTGVPGHEPGAVVARGRTIEGLRLGVGATKGARFVGLFAAPDDEATPSVGVLGYRPPGGLVEISPGGRAGVAGWIGLAEG